MESQNDANRKEPVPRLSIVLPAYNEEGNIERAVREALAGAAKAEATCEVVVVNDGSRDGTARILQKLEAELGSSLRVVDHPANLGYGAALRDGFRATRGELVFYTDSDNQFDLGELGDFMPLMKDNDVVLGYRVDRQDPLARRITARVYNLLAWPKLIKGYRQAFWRKGYLRRLWPDCW